MSELFNNYKEMNLNNQIPDNRHKYLHFDDEFKNKLVLGATNTYSFDLYQPKDDIKEVLFTYSQGLSIILTKKFLLDEFQKVSEEDDFLTGPEGSKLYEITKWPSLTPNKNKVKAVLVYKITPEESLMFNNYNLDTNLQMRLTLDNQDEVIYSKNYKLDLVPTNNPQGIETND